ncbi:hypothetical protein ACJX0J_028531, partial [Zea mays]
NKALQAFDRLTTTLLTKNNQTHCNLGTHGSKLWAGFLHNHNLFHRKTVDNHKLYVYITFRLIDIDFGSLDQYLALVNLLGLLELAIIADLNSVEARQATIST